MSAAREACEPWLHIETSWPDVAVAVVLAAVLAWWLWLRHR